MVQDLEPDFVTLTCPSCGGKLQVTNDIDRFACAHCGTEQVVRRGGGIVSLSPVLDRLAEVEAEVDEAVSELAVKQLSEEIAKLEVELERAKSQWKGLLIAGIACFAIGLLCAVSDQVGAMVFFWTVGVVAIAVNRAIVSSNKRKQIYLNVRVENKRSELMKHLGVICQSPAAARPSRSSDE
jgi:ribosomal protein S27AE